MVKFVIIEDDLDTQKEVKRIVIKNLFSNNIEFKIEIYDKFNQKLKETIKDSSQKKIFLIDIELKESISGIEIASFIREDDWESEIIFITNHDKMFEEVYRTIYKVFSFIEKYHNFESRLSKDIKQIIKKGYDNQMLKVISKKISLQIYYKDILYITRDTIDRKLIIYTCNNKFIVSSSIENIMIKLDNRFKRVHRACIVNSEMVIEYNWRKRYFKLNNGNQVFLLSKNYRKETE